MKKLNVVLAVLMFGAAALTACSGKTDTLAVADRETQSQWGLTFNEQESEAEKESDTKTEEPSVKELNNGVKLLELDDVSLQALSAVNVRSGPGTDFDKLGKLAESDIVTMEGICDNEWVQIDFDGESGYVSMGYVKPVDESVSLDALLEQVKALGAEDIEESTEESSAEDIEESTEESSAEESSTGEGQFAWATTDVNVRKGPKSSYEAIGYLKQGESVKVLDSSDAWWWKVEFNGQEAYISVQFLTTEKPEE